MLTQPDSRLMRPGPGWSGRFFSTSNFDLWYFCSRLSYKVVWYLIWKIWFISAWSKKPKAVVWLLKFVMLAQSTSISYHTEANGCIFFAAGVWMLFDFQTLERITWHVLINYTFNFNLFLLKILTKSYTFVNKTSIIKLKYLKYVIVSQSNDNCLQS